MFNSLNNKFKNSFKKKILLSIIRNYDCPIWVYDANIILHQIKLLKKFDVIRFAQKACSNINILKLMIKAGVKVDAVSLGEIERALIAGFNIKDGSDNIIYTSDLFDKNTLNRVVELNLTVNIGSIDMLYQLGRISPGHKIWLRINPGFGDGHNNKTITGGKNSKHGIWYEELLSIHKIINKFNFNLKGLHIHIGSGVNYNHLQKVCNFMISQVIKLNRDIKAISAGGGLPIPYKNTDKKIDTVHYYEIWDDARKKISQHLKHHVKLEIEPGRFLVGQAGVLISEIRTIKFIDNRRFILVNAGFNDLMRPTMYGSYHKMSIMTCDNRRIDLSKNIKTIVAGPLCEAGDVFNQTKNTSLQEIMLPMEAEVGDYIIIHDVGAYGASMSSNYNTRPLIPEILIENNIVKEIRRKQTIKELISLEIL